MITTIKYLWHNKVLALIAIVGLVGAVYLFHKTYTIQVISRTEWATYQDKDYTVGCNEDCMNQVRANWDEQTKAGLTH